MTGAIKLVIITSLLSMLGGAFYWYTDFIQTTATAIQKSSDEAQQATAANQSYIEAIEWLRKDSKEKQRQIYLRDKVYAEVDQVRKDLEIQLLEAGDEKFKECSALVVPKPIIDRMRGIFNEGSTDGNKAVDKVSESVPVPIAVQEDDSRPSVRNVTGTVAERLDRSFAESQRR